MDYLPITLSVKRKASRSDSPLPPASDALYRENRKKVLARDKNCCRFCGLKSQKNEVHHLDDDHANQSIENLVTACVLCHMCFHIAYAGTQNRGSLIYLPDNPVTQGGLNALVRSLWIAEDMSTGDIKSTAINLLARLDKATGDAIKVVGTKSPTMLGEFMSLLDDASYSSRADGLNGIYLLPTRAAYTSHIKSWVNDTKQFPPTEWVRRAQDKIAQWQSQ